MMFYQDYQDISTSYKLFTGEPFPKVPCDIVFLFTNVSIIFIVACRLIIKKMNNSKLAGFFADDERS